MAASASTTNITPQSSRPKPRGGNVRAFIETVEKGATKPKPRGGNVRAFIETVEKGAKPKPDFFNSEAPDLQTEEKTITTASRVGTQNSKVKPPVLHKKPNVHKTETKKKSVRVRPPSQPPPPPPPSVVMDPPPPPPAVKDPLPPAPITSTSYGYDFALDTNCPSEDSGNSTCDLKYSGSISSTQSSSHDPNYMTLSELDDGYSGHVSATSNGGASNSTLQSQGDYCLPSQSADPEGEDGTEGSTAAGTSRFTPHSKPPTGSAAASKSSSKVYQSAYKYHVPGRLTGTLPKDRKKAAFIGKAVAKGRTTLKKKISSTSSDKTEQDYSTLKSLKSIKSSMTDSTGHSDLDYTDSEFDTDLSDSEWETDGEESSNLADNQSTDTKTTSTALPDRNRLSVQTDDSLYEGITVSSPTRSHTAKIGSSKFYDVIDESDSAKTLVHLMRSSSSKKEKNTRIKKRLTHIKGNIMESKFVQSSNSKFSAMKTFISSKLKKPVVPKPDYGPGTSGPGTSVDNQHYSAAGSELSLETETSATDSHSDLHSVSSISSSTYHPIASVTSTSDGMITGSHGHAATIHLIPRPKSIQTDVRAKTRSLGMVLDIPPLPPRATTRSQFIPESTALDYLPVPPPPPRTTSRGLGGPQTDNDSTSDNSRSLHAGELTDRQSSSSSVSRFKPVAAPRSPKSLHSSTPEEFDEQEFDEMPPPLPPSVRSLAKLSNPEITLHKARSVPVLSNEGENDSISRLVIERKESSKSLKVTSGDGDDLLRADDGEMENNNKSSISKVGYSRKARKISAPIDEEQTISTSLPSSMLNISVPAPTRMRKESDREAGLGSAKRDGLIVDEPLYQVYHECMITTIKHKSIGKTSTLMKGGQPTHSLWSTTPAVLNSGVLDHMSSEEIKLQEAMFEVITSEASYLRSLNVLNKVFVNSTQFSNEDILPSRDRKDLFSNISAVADVSTRLFTELEAHWKSSVILTSVCDIVSKYAHKEFDVYIKYCSNQAYQDRTTKRLQSQNAGFRESLAVLERSPECKCLSMSSFLLLPMQRVTRLPLLLDAIQRRLGASSDQYRSAQICYGLIKKVVSKCNEGARKMEQTEQVISIETKLLFNRLKKIPLTSASRQLIKKGELVYFSTDGGRSTKNLLALKPKTLSLFLFNDLLLVTRKKGDHYAVIDYGARVNVGVEEWSISSLKDSRLNMMAHKSQAKFMFMLVLLENHEKKHLEFLLSCVTETERTRWMEAFTSPAQAGDCDDKIYEVWDCPQVQATHDYVSQQPDELDLTTGDVINVLRKTADGWYEGERVSDGHTGWLPSSYAAELHNDHVKARHLKERYKLLQAAAKIMK